MRCNEPECNLPPKEFLYLPKLNFKLNHKLMNDELCFLSVCVDLKYWCLMLSSDYTVSPALPFWMGQHNRHPTSPGSSHILIASPWRLQIINNITEIIAVCVCVCLWALRTASHLYRQPVQVVKKIKKGQNCVFHPPLTEQIHTRFDW